MRYWQLAGQRPFLIFWAGRIVSGLGDNLFMMATMWYVLNSTNSALLTSVVPLVPTLCLLLLGLPLAALADRWPKRPALIWTDVVRGLAILAFFGLMAYHIESVFLIYLFNFIVTVGQLIFSPTQQTILPAVLRNRTDELPLATGMLSATSQLVRLVGYGAGGALVALIGAANAVFVDAISFFLSAASLVLLTIPAVGTSPPKKPGFAAFWKGSVAGIQFIWSIQPLRVLVLIGMAVNMSSAPLQFFTAIFSRQVLHRGVTGYGALEGAAAIGALFGALVAGRYSKRLPLSLWMTMSLILTGLSLMAMTVIPVFWVALTLFGLAMGSSALFNVPFASALMLLAPDDIRGRVMTAFGMFFSVSVPVGLVIGGWLTDIIGPRVIFLAIGAFLALSSAWGILVNRLEGLGPGGHHTSTQASPAGSPPIK